MVTLKEPGKRLLLGTAGHIDHGKTALVKLFSGCETDRLPEEKKRGMSIDLGFGSCLLGRDVRIGIVDVPGHEKFIRNMVAGVSAIDLILLVVAADDGVMPQTREHLQIVELLGKKKGLVALTKIDMVDAELAELAAEETSEFLKGTFLEGAPVVPVSSITGEGYDVFWQTLKDTADAIEPRDPRGVFRMPVERVFSVKGIGTVVTGMPLTGTVRVDEKLELLPSGKPGRVRGLQVFKAKSKRAMAGDCVAINLPDLDHKEVHRGMVVAHPGYFRSASMVDARFTMLPMAPHALKDGAPVRFHVGTAEVLGRIALLDRKRMEPGETSFVQIRLEEPVVVDARDRFILRLQSPMVTVGGGVIIREQDRKLRRFRDYVMQDLTDQEAAIATDEGSVGFALKARGMKPTKPKDIEKSSRQTADVVEESLKRMVASGEALALPGGTGYLHRDGLAEGAQALAELLGAFHKAHPFRSGLSRSRLRNDLKFDRNAFDFLVDFETDAGRLIQGEGVVGLSEKQPHIDGQTETQLAAIEASYREGGFSPPSDETAGKAAGIDADRAREISEYLIDHGSLIELGEGIVFHTETVDRAKKALVAYLKEHGEIGAVSFRDLVGASRKYVYPLLDYFDLKGITVRRGNLRYLRSG